MGFAERPEGEWLVFGDSAYASLIKAYGGDVFNGVKYTPDLNRMALLDPEGEFTDVYNRYAHITVEELKERTPRFELVYHDSYIIHLDTCDPVLDELEVDFLFFSYDPGPIPCADEIFTRIDGDVHLRAYQLHSYEDMLQSTVE